MRDAPTCDRRNFLAAVATTTGATLFASGNRPVSAEASPTARLKLGVASYSLRKFSLDEAIAMTQALGMARITLKSMHLPLESTQAERKAAAQKIADAGISLVGGGVIYLPNDVSTCRNAFEYARDTGMPVIVASPDLEALPLVDSLVKEFDIKVAIHNHGPGDDKYPLPIDAYNAAKPFDKRIGCCMDIGHTVRIGGNEIESIHAVKDRLYDFHMKDVTLRAPEGKNTEVGRGVVDIPGALKALIEVGFTGHVALEYEKNPSAPMPGMHESVGYMKGVLDGLQRA
jgi:sugar phosphate isomerase/epimerase